ncbi:MAG: hypothetical protein RLZZ74_1642 [Cyanobacteriota bacterium]|jgi:hypothetical protein
MIFRPSQYIAPVILFSVTSSTIFDDLAIFSYPFLFRTTDVMLLVSDRHARIQIIQC